MQQEFPWESGTASASSELNTKNTNQDSVGENLDFEQNLNSNLSSPFAQGNKSSPKKQLLQGNQSMKNLAVSQDATSSKNNLNINMSNASASTGKTASLAPRSSTSSQVPNNLLNQPMGSTDNNAAQSSNANSSRKANINSNSNALVPRKRRIMPWSQKNTSVLNNSKAVNSSNTNIRQSKYPADMDEYDPDFDEPLAQVGVSLNAGKRKGKRQTWTDDQSMALVLLFMILFEIDCVGRNMFNGVLLN